MYQGKLLTQAQALRHEAEMAVSEMEEAAKIQLHNLANQSQVTLSAIEERFARSREKLNEFHIVVRVWVSMTLTGRSYRMNSLKPIELSSVNKDSLV